MDMLTTVGCSVEPMTDGFILLDGGGVILLCNYAVLHIFSMEEPPIGRVVGEVFADARKQCPPLQLQEFCKLAQSGPFPSHTYISFAKKQGGECYEVSFARCEQDGACYVLCCLKKIPATVFSEERRPEGFVTGTDWMTPEAITQAFDDDRYALELQNAALRRRVEDLEAESLARNAVIQALRRAELGYRDIVDNACEGIVQWTPDRRLCFANTAFAKHLGYSTVDALMRAFADEEFVFFHNAAKEQELVCALEHDRAVSGFDLQVVSIDGSPVWVCLYARRVAGADGTTQYYEAFVNNISKRKCSEEELHYKAFHDPLTTLANRALFTDRLRMAMRRSLRQKDPGFAVLYMDLNRFKMINDVYGHNAGDDLLCQAGMRIASCLRASDTVARFGGDEFAVLLEEVDQPSLVVKIARRIHASLIEPFHVLGQEMFVGASIGIVLHAEKYSHIDDILRDADMAMYRAKAAAKSPCKVFCKRMQVESAKPQVCESDLRHGLDAGEFCADYQPVMNLDTGRLYGFEAFLRWRHSGNKVTPAFFIPAAEEYDLMSRLGLYMIELVCRQVAHWHQSGTPPGSVHLNISGKELTAPDFEKQVLGILERTDVDPACLYFEITEGMLMDHGVSGIKVIQRLSERGLRFCLDDFGTGFASLNYLRQLPLASIKVDRRFVADIEKNDSSLIIVENILNLGRQLGLAVIVEGVERQGQVQALRSVGCSLCQGYHLQEPVEAEKAAALLHAEPSFH